VRVLDRRPARANVAVGTTWQALRFYRSDGSAAAWHRLFAHPACRAVGREMPIWLTLAVTYRSQYPCIRCHAERRQRDPAEEMTAAEVESVPGQAAKGGVLEVMFYGGEPLLRDGLPELVARGRSLGLLTRPSTNGILPERGHPAALGGAGLTQLGVSIDHADPATHDRMHGLPGTFDAAIQGIWNLREFGIPCQMMTYAPRGSVDAGPEDVVALGRGLHVLAACAIPSAAPGRRGGSCDQLLGEQERAWVRSIQDLTFTYLELPTARSMCRVAAKTSAYVPPPGDVTPCSSVPYSMENIRQTGLAALWRSYCNGLRLDCRGDCVMTEERSRRRLVAHLASVMARHARPTGAARSGARAAGRAEAGGGHAQWG
jgi:MoaA/NifB/PqqE/SkfB family radical SAM enzyme